MSVYKKNISFRGFTLIELLVTLVIAGIVMSIGVPSFNETIKNGRLTSNINELVTSLSFARSEAVKRNQLVSVKKTGTQWESGWSVFTDSDGDGNKETGDVLLRTYGAAPSSFTLRGSADYITYQASGMINGGASALFVLCENSDANNTPEANTSRLMMVNGIGRTSMGQDSDNNDIPEIQDGTNISSCITSPFT